MTRRWVRDWPGYSPTATKAPGLPLIPPPGQSPDARVLGHGHTQERGRFQLGVRQICGFPFVTSGPFPVRAEEAASFQRPSRSALPRTGAPFETRPEKMAAPQGERSGGASMLYLRVRLLSDHP